jgi:pimeloyl-ACP methyl ester carboxylesterase
MKSLRLAILMLLLLGTSTAVHAQCPPGLPPGTTCHSGVDIHGAFFLIAVPANYNDRLVLWNHGYTLSPPAPLSAGDLGVGALALQLGYAAAASSYRPDAVGLSGWQVRDAAEDVDMLRRQFITIFGRPAKTYVVGASEGGLITAEIIERFGRDEDGRLNYHGALPLCGPVAGGAANWYGGFDLRVVCQNYCQNLPRPNELQYPLYLGLAPNNMLSPTDVALRVNECTGVLQPPATRTPQQKRNLANILGVTKLPESFLIIDMFFATFALQELTLVRTFGLSPVTNLGVHYQGSDDDMALNADVFRAGFNEEANEWLNRAYNPNGRVAIPTVTMHTIGDGLVIVENEHEYREEFIEEGRRHRLFQLFINAGGHCQFTNSEIAAAFQTLVNWVEKHERPTQKATVTLCNQFQSVFGDACNINTDFHPGEFEARVAPRNAPGQP